MLAKKIHLLALYAFFVLLGLFEGPAEIACIVALATYFVAHRPSKQDLTLGAVELGIVVWFLAGWVGVLLSDVQAGTETLTRPLLAFAYVLGRGSISALPAGALTRLAWLFGAALVFNGAYGLLQVWGFDPPLETFIIGRHKHGNLIDPQHPERLRMATGLFYNRMKLAHLGVVGLSLFAVLMGVGGRARRAAVLGTVILGAAVFLTYRRAAPLSLLVALFTFGILFGGVNRRSWLKATGAVGLVVIGAFLATATGRVRLVQAKEALLERFEIYGYALSLWRESPWFGVGHGHYPTRIGSITEQLSPLLQQSAHSWLIETLVETGVVGATALVAAIVTALTRVSVHLSLRPQVAASDQVLLRRFAWVALVSLLLIGLVHSVLYHRPVILAFWLLLGVAASPLERKRSVPLGSKEPD